MDIEKIANMLTPGEKRAVIWLGAEPKKRPRYGARPFVWLHQKGLAVWVDHHERVEALNEHGLAVREYLEKSHD